ncbi:MAG: hypothetical protein ABSG46_07065 [Candidatus Binataceae bacterium]
MDSGDTKLKAFDFFKEAATQLITLALGVVVFSATFYKDMITGASRHHIVLECSWALFLVSVIFGILVVGTLSWQLNAAGDPKALSIYSARWTAAVQLVAFILAIGLFALFIGSNMTDLAAKPLPPAIFER